MNRTHDRAAVMSSVDKMPFYAPGQLGKTRRLTPEKYLLCEGVAIARTGEQQYRADELALTPDASGIITIHRVAEEVFDPESMASFEGKSVTMEHPPMFCSPETYKRFEVGTVHNVRRGEGVEDELLIADLLIKDPKAIEWVNTRRPQLSNGYDSEYDDSPAGVGHYIQRQIRGNHTALVDYGRAGSRVSTRDSVSFLSPPEDNTMSVRTRFGRIFKRALDAATAKDARALDEAAEEMEDMMDPGNVNKLAEFHPSSDSEKLKEAMDWIRDRKAKDVAEEERKTAEKKAEDARKAKDEEEEKKKAEDARKAKDEEEKKKDEDSRRATDTAARMTDVMSFAEVLCPGIKAPTQDALSVVDAIPNFQFQAITEACKNADTLKVIESTLAPLGLSSVAQITKDHAPAVFAASTVLMKARNKGVMPGVKKTEDGTAGKAVDAKTFSDKTTSFWDKVTATAPVASSSRT
jgi:hypothetical protein